MVLAADRLSAELQIGPGPAATVADLRAAIAAAGVVHGLDEPAIDALAAHLGDPAFAGKAVVARGSAPVPGADGRIDYAFANGPQSGHRRADGAVDFRERALLHPADLGAEVARIVPPRPGCDGRDVTGRVLPAPVPKPATLRAGSGVAVQDDGRVLAVRSGVVTMPASGIDVLPLYTHPGDVDLHCGNLHSHGSVQVSGDVHSGFTVEADGDVAVQGSVFGGRIAAGGAVTIGLGAQAGSRVEAGGDLHCRHATNSVLRAAGALVIADETVHCDAAAATIELAAGRGRALGGSLRARERLLVIHAGSPTGAPTVLAAGDLTSEASELVRRAQAVDRIDRRARKAGPLEAGPQRGGKLGRLRTVAADAAQQQKLEHARRQRELLRTATIEVRGTAHLGVRIQLGPAVLQLARECTDTRFRWDATAGTIVQESR